MLQQIDRVRLFGPAAPDRGMPTLAFAVSGCSSSDVAAQLRRRWLIVGSGLQCAPLAHRTLGTEASGLVRLSVGVGQPDEEIDEAIDRLSSTLTKGFLPVE
jgi:selenocysteine lyase/cysteine desulfurase